MVSYYLPSGSKIGVGFQAHALANALSDAGHELHMFSNCAPVAGRRYAHHTLELHGNLRTFRFALAIRRLDLSSFDVIHAHGEDYWLWQRRAAAHVRTLHGSCFDEAIHIRGAKERTRMLALGLSEVLATSVADKTVAVSPASARWTPWVKTVIPNGVDRNRFALPRRPDPNPTILFVGTWSNRKRGALLADVFSRQVKPVVPNARLRMVTADAPSSLPDGVEALGRLSDEELAQEYSRAWIFCLPSTYEGFGIPYAEAMTAGVPVVATPNPGSRYVLDEGRVGSIVDEQQLGAALVELLQNTELRGQYAADGLARAREFDIESIVAQYLAIYKDLARGAG